MSENTDSFFFLDDEKTYQIFDPLQNEFNTKCEDYSFNKFKYFFEFLILLIIYLTFSLYFYFSYLLNN